MQNDNENDINSAPIAESKIGNIKAITMGCRLNTYETEAMKLAARSINEEIILINTCAVTSEAVRQAKQAIRKAKRDNPNAKIIVSGCAAQIDPQSFAQMEEVEKVIGNSEKTKPETYQGLLLNDERIIVDDILSVKETAHHLIDGIEGRTRAYIQVQNGCDHRCTFCVIPFGRGNSRSVPAAEVVRTINRLIDKGIKEIVLSGVDLTSWGGDLPGGPSLGNLVERILKLCPDLPRLRLSSIDAVEIDETLFRVFAQNPRIMPHLHLSLQHGDDLILKRMKRRHLRKDAIDLVARLKSVRPDIVFGADIIAGFPTETEEQFSQSISLIDEAQLSFVHVFPYSPRPMTPAAKMPQHPRS
ncbi:MAG: tRNA (N(6)-L-threonylcarbamoyladenosine(37)-C(2))-methylthiotransferase MtaB, partial [Caulobacterales bacterium]|nr:tRNA (N(6)-L-threonylcarbamoyladenosine(37)-C(2))-methylthiotransferase MtaB [Caulobacterales bacterium]